MEAATQHNKGGGSCRSSSRGTNRSVRAVTATHVNAQHNTTQQRQSQSITHSFTHSFFVEIKKKVSHMHIYARNARIDTFTHIHTHSHAHTLSHTQYAHTHTTLTATHTGDDGIGGGSCLTPPHTRNESGWCVGDRCNARTTTYCGQSKCP